MPKLLLPSPPRAAPRMEMPVSKHGNEAAVAVTGDRPGQVRGGGMAVKSCGCKTDAGGCPHPGLVSAGGSSGSSAVTCRS